MSWYSDSVANLEKALQEYGRGRKLFLERKLHTVTTLDDLAARVVDLFNTVSQALLIEVAASEWLSTRGELEANAYVLVVDPWFRANHSEVIRAIEPVSQAFVAAFRNMHKLLADGGELLGVTQQAALYQATRDFGAARQTFFNFAARITSDIYEANYEAELKFYESVSTASVTKPADVQDVPLSQEADEATDPFRLAVASNSSPKGKEIPNENH